MLLLNSTFGLASWAIFENLLWYHLHDVHTAVSASFFSRNVAFSNFFRPDLNVHSKECSPWQKGRNAQQNLQCI